MIAAFRQLPFWAWGMLALIAVLGAGLIYQSLALGFVRTEYADYKSAIVQQAMVFEQRAREEERRRQAAIDEVREHAQQQIKAVIADAVIAQRSADSLQLEVTQLLANRAGQNSRLAQRGATIRDLGTVLADLRQRADQRAGELAAIADASRVAGQACEAAYDALSKEFTGLTRTHR